MVAPAAMPRLIASVTMQAAPRPVPARNRTPPSAERWERSRRRAGTEFSSDETDQKRRAYERRGRTRDTFRQSACDAIQFRQAR